MSQKRVLGVAAALLMAWPFFAWAAAQFLIVRTEGNGRADALVVLGSSSAYVERTRWAAQLFQAGNAPKVVLTNDNERSGWSSKEQRNPPFVELAVAQLQRAGVPADKIEVLPQPVSSTHDEAVLLRRYFEEHQIRSLVFVTSAYHSRRALWTLRRVFGGSNIEIEMNPATTGDFDWQSPPSLTWWWKRRGWRSVALEYPKLIYYWLHY
jgi:uncharacterized SAM-binding protein YcdF (DUF218 family)